MANQLRQPDKLFKIATRNLVRGIAVRVPQRTIGTYMTTKLEDYLAPWISRPLAEQVAFIANRQFCMKCLFMNPNKDIDHLVERCPYHPFMTRSPWMRTLRRVAEMYIAAQHGLPPRDQVPFGVWVFSSRWAAPDGNEYDVNEIDFLNFFAYHGFISTFGELDVDIRQLTKLQICYADNILWVGTKHKNRCDGQTCVYNMYLPRIYLPLLDAILASPSHWELFQLDNLPTI